MREGRSTALGTLQPDCCFQGARVVAVEFSLSLLSITNYASLSTIELNVNEEISCKRQNQSFLSKKYILPK